MDNLNPANALCCPLCQAENHCAVAMGAEITQCWCQAQPILPWHKLKPLLIADRGEQWVDELERRQHCLCRHCFHRLVELAQSQ